MNKYEPAVELITKLLDFKQYSSAADVELFFVDSFNVCSDLMAAEILKFARSGDYTGLENLVVEINDAIAFHHRWELALTQILSRDDHLNRDADCLKQALIQTKNVRRSLGSQVAVACSIKDCMTDSESCAVRH